MERKEQTGHICRWMALGIMTAIVIVGCTIVIGLFEWRDRKEIYFKLDDTKGLEGARGNNPMRPILAF